MLRAGDGTARALRKHGRAVANGTAALVLSAGLALSGAPLVNASHLQNGNGKYHHLSSALRKSKSLHAPSPPAFLQGKWALKFDDEFDGSKINNKWSYCYAVDVCYASGKPGDFRQMGYSVPRNCSMQPHVLNLLVTKGDHAHKYFSCILQTHSHFNFTYGYVEARMWLPASTDSWPAFWMLNSTSKGRAPSEIDVMEDYGGTEKYQYFHYHYPRGRTELNLGSKVAVPGATSGWHTYAVEWMPGSIKWYYDGRLVWHEDHNVYNHKMYLILNLVLDSFKPDPSVPSTLRVNYVRVWQKDGM